MPQHGSADNPHGVPLDALGNKADPTGKSIDDFLRSIFPGALPTSTEQEFAPPDDTVGQQVEAPIMGTARPPVTGMPPLGGGIQTTELPPIQQSPEANLLATALDTPAPPVAAAPQIAINNAEDPVSIDKAQQDLTLRAIAEPDSSSAPISTQEIVPPIPSPQLEPAVNNGPLRPDDPGLTPAEEMEAQTLTPPGTPSVNVGDTYAPEGLFKTIKAARSSNEGIETMFQKAIQLIDNPAQLDKFLASIDPAMAEEIGIMLTQRDIGL